ncbi:MAG: nucleotidyltransferase [Phycisphaerae bacterium]|nr:nucleotidyltransferase [Phycisphaerae bacterium]
MFNQAAFSSQRQGITVSQRFDRFLSNLRLTEDQRQDGITKHGGVRSCLNEHYWGTTSTTANSMLVGSWGKNTEIRPPRDIDVLFCLPKSVYDRFQTRPGNKQSQLLQEVKDVLTRRYGSTTMRGDGQVVVVKFASYAVEVVPAFTLTSGQYWICNTHNGGSYQTIDPAAEIEHVRESNSATSGNSRDLIRMLKCWQWNCSVPLKSFWLELLAVDFLRTWEHRGKSTTYYDWMVRDFLRWLVGKAWSYVYVPGTGEIISIGDAWKSRAETARDRAVRACDLEAADKVYDAGVEWQKIFGTQIPVS